MHLALKPSLLGLEAHGLGESDQIQLSEREELMPSLISKSWVGP